jgi:hypothetical protein
MKWRDAPFLKPRSDNDPAERSGAFVFMLHCNEVIFGSNFAGRKIEIYLDNGYGAWYNILRNIMAWPIVCAIKIGYKKMVERMSEMLKMKDGFITHTIGDEQMMVATGSAAEAFHGMVQSNSTAAFIVDCLKQPTTEDAIVDQVIAHYAGVDRATAAADVHEILEKLRSIHALEES